MFFSAEIDKTPNVSGMFLKEKTFIGQKTIKGIGAGAYLTFNTQENEQITAKIGLSYTSIDNARLNREKETQNGKLTFDAAHKMAQQTCISGCYTQRS